MYSTGFSMETERIAEPADGPSTQFLVEQARAHGVWVCASVPDASAERRTRPVNQLVLAGPDGATRTTTTRSTRSPTAGEHEHYAAGDAFLTVDDRGRARSASSSATTCASPTSSGRSRTDDRLLRRRRELARESARALARAAAARAIENQAYVVGVNRVGDGGDLALRRRLA